MALPHHSHYRKAAKPRTRDGSGGPAAPRPCAGGAARQAPCTPTTWGTGRPPLGLCPPARKRIPKGLQVNSSSAFTLRQFTESGPTGTSGAGSACHPCIRSPVDCGGGQSCDLAAHTGQASTRIFMQPRDTAHAPLAAAHTAGRRGIYLFSPNSPGTSKPWPLVPEAQAARSGAGRAGQGSDTGPRVLCWDGDIALRRLCGQWARGQVHARPRAPASGASPGPGRCLKGCLPGQGGFAGAGCSCSSDCGCSCDSPACPGGKQAGRPSSWLKTRKPSRIRERKQSSVGRAGGSSLCTLRAVRPLAEGERQPESSGVSGSRRAPRGGPGVG